MKSTLPLFAILALVLVAGFAYEILTRPTSTPEVTTFYCVQGEMNAIFGEESVALSFGNGRSLSLPQVVSASGIRYEATIDGKHELFVGKGSYAQLFEDDLDVLGNCVAAHLADEEGGAKRYTSQERSFSFVFPGTFKIVGADPGYTTGWSVNATTSGMVLAQVVKPGSALPGTNFSDARFTVGASSDPEALAACLKPPYAESAGNAAIGGLTFVKFVENDAGAGNRYDTTSYRIIRDNQCYALEYTIHYGAIQNFPKGTVQEFDETAVAHELDAVATSFGFLQ